MNEINSDLLLPFNSEKFISNKNLDAYYYPEEKAIHFIWKQRSIAEAYRQPFLDANTFTDTNEAIYFLSDIRKQGIVGPDDRKWFEEEALPLAINKGLKRTAIVYDGNVFKLYYINMVLKHFKRNGVEMKFFNSLQEAKDWLFLNNN